MEHEYRARRRVGRFASRGEAQVARAMLSEHGIEADVDADDAAGLHPELSLATGGISLSVAAEDVEEARELLDDVQTEAAADHLPRGRRVRPWVLLVAAVLATMTIVLALAEARLLPYVPGAGPVSEGPA
jgi:hypothetical protein